jgi:hypothetical protein
LAAHGSVIPSATSAARRGVRPSALGRIDPPVLSKSDPGILT